MLIVLLFEVGLSWLSLEVCKIEGLSENCHENCQTKALAHGWMATICDIKIMTLGDKLASKSMLQIRGVSEEQG